MKIILASKSGVRKEILDKNNIKCEVMPSNVDEDQVKDYAVRKDMELSKARDWLESILSR